jgi:hypothetical protein
MQIECLGEHCRDFLPEREGAALGFGFEVSN